MRDLVLRPERPSGASASDPDLLHAAGTDPEGFLVARRGEIAVGRAAAVVRGATLQVVFLEVEREARGKGVGRALLAALRAYGRSRGARGVELPVPVDPSALGFALRSGLPLATLFVRMEAPGPGLDAPGAAGEPTLLPVAAGAALGGWVADLDRETRGFARPAEWSSWIARPLAEVLAFRRRGRPEAVGAILPGAGRRTVGPVVARTPEAAAEMLTLLARRAASGARRVALTLPAEAPLLVDAAARLGFQACGSFALFSSARHGDFRRYAGAGTTFL